MGVVVTVNCDRCDSVIRSGAGTAAEEFKAKDLRVVVPWYSHWLDYDDLCDGCRNAIVGYLASAFKLDRTVLTSQCIGNDGNPLKATKGDTEGPALPLSAPRGRAKPPEEPKVAVVTQEEVTGTRTDLADANGVPTVKGAEMMFAAKDETAARRLGGPLPPSSDDDDHDDHDDHDEEGVTL